MSRQIRVILLVEDSEDDADLTLRAFHASGVNCKIVRARDGRQALDYVFGLGDWAGRNSGQPPALILLDLKLPCVSGLDVLRQLRQSPVGQHIPVVVMSCSTEQADIAASYGLGANSYIRKPVDFVEFAGAVELIGSYWLGLNHLPLSQGGLP
ncbi:MAG TPA: response regulator [Polyangia bacterium]